MLPIGDVGIAEVIGTSVKDVETLDLNVDLEKVKTVTKPVSKRRIMLSFVVEFQTDWTKVGETCLFTVGSRRG